MKGTFLSTVSIKKTYYNVIIIYYNIVIFVSYKLNKLTPFKLASYCIMPFSFSTRDTRIQVNGRRLGEKPCSKYHILDYLPKMCIYPRLMCHRLNTAKCRLDDFHMLKVYLYFKSVLILNII